MSNAKVLGLGSCGGGFTIWGYGCSLRSSLMPLGLRCRRVSYWCWWLNQCRPSAQRNSPPTARMDSHRVATSTQPTDTRVAGATPSPLRTHHEPVWRSGRTDVACAGTALSIALTHGTFQDQKQLCHIVLVPWPWGVRRWFPFDKAGAVLTKTGYIW
jgi:hypothetical protein